jgi:hypothetical protein
MMTAQQAQACVTASFSEVTRSLRRTLPSTPVRIKYLHHDHNKLRDREEAVFACYTNASQPQFIGVHFESAFSSFDQQPATQP